MFLFFFKSESLIKIFHSFLKKLFFSCSDFFVRQVEFISVALTEKTLSFNNIFVVNFLWVCLTFPW